ncbi:hypothetical protein C1A38_21280 [Verrucosispora sp. ts21]|uniref:DUF4037 domain-containing protein n=1 Tax=Verrucosispora sp. ts21 TaxID=2069341 RepID=UPI000C87E9A6|nr:DUF4037 domain-containing protein [Verrucosispora sp. ts21]PMR59066.1 hypothetical protein C1A38_21280 [Verrucosispora sp. ts21]
MRVPAFVPGLSLAASTYHEAVRPILDVAFPRLVHSAALLGPGSDVLGYDTARSTDHDWGPRLLLFLAPADARRHADDLVGVLAERLPSSVQGWSTNFSPPEPGRSRTLQPVGDAPIAHRIEVLDLDTWLATHLGPDPRDGMHTRDWLAIPTQRLLEVTSGAVFHDGLGHLTSIRAALAWYPDDIWRYLLACQWRRIAQEEAFPGRCAEVGDDLGSRLVTARLVRDLMRLALLVERRYPPYAKWLGTAFVRLRCAPTLQPLLTDALTAADWPHRESALCAAYEHLARAHNDLGLCDPVEPTVRPFHDRPMRVLAADRFADATHRAITDPEVSTLPRHVGGVDQFVDSTDVLGVADRARAVTGALYGPHAP